MQIKNMYKIMNQWNYDIATCVIREVTECMYAHHDALFNLQMINFQQHNTVTTKQNKQFN